MTVRGNNKMSVLTTGKDSTVKSLAELKRLHDLQTELYGNRAASKKST